MILLLHVCTDLERHALTVWSMDRKNLTLDFDRLCTESRLKVRADFMVRRLSVEIEVIRAFRRHPFSEHKDSSSNSLNYIAFTS